MGATAGSAPGQSWAAGHHSPEGQVHLVRGREPRVGRGTEGAASGGGTVLSQGPSMLQTRLGSGPGTEASAQPYPTLATPWTVALQAPPSGTLQARMLEWVAISFSRGSFPLRK